MRFVINKRVLLLGLAICGLLISSQLPGQQVAALSGSQFNAANIIDPNVFLNPGSLNAGDVQNFLNAKVPNCDTNGDQIYSGSQTRRAYSQAHDPSYNPPYTCLKDYSQDVPSKDPDAYCNNGIAGAHKTAAQIIFDVSQACGISPKVLIVLLQKESGLVTDDWPWPSQYQAATGYACPDTAPCDSQYYGFFNQVYNAARQFQRYIREPQNFNFRAGQTSNIQYSPHADCGSSAINIQNGSTAALYNYTPYQPSQAALNNLNSSVPGDPAVVGSDAYCAAYGNRNFWRDFSNWFGSTQTNTPYAWTLNSVQIYANSARTQVFPADTTVAPNGHVYIRVTATNIGNQTWTKSQLNFGIWPPQQNSSSFYDSSWLSANRPATLVENSVPPGSVGTFEFVLTAPSTTGQYQERFNLVAENITWLNNLGLSIIVNVVSPIAEPTGTTRNILHAGEKLFPSAYLISSEGQSVLNLQSDGNLVLYDDFKATWNTMSFGHPPDHLEMGADGNLVLFFKDGRAPWTTNTPTHPNAYLKIQSDGNLVLYDSNNVPYWNTVTFQSPDNLSYVNTTLRTNTMFPGQLLQTADRSYKLVFQTDGNLVLYSTSHAIWSSGTLGQPSSYLTMQADGNLVIYDINGHALWNTRTNGKGSSQLAIQQDGNLVIYAANGQASWSSGTFGQ